MAVAVPASSSKLASQFNEYEGCSGHHIIEWEIGGQTNLDNLISLCSTHHHAVHDLGWRIVGNPEEDVQFISPLGGVFESGPPVLQPRLRNFFDDLLEEQLTEATEEDLATPFVDSS